MFASSALSLAAREARLHLVVGLSRFLIRPGIACRNLASRTMGLRLRRPPTDSSGRGPGTVFGDPRLTSRLVRCVEMQAKAPSKTLFSAAAGDEAAVTGYYRLIEQPDESKATPEAILATHRARTEQRMRRQETVLCIQDGTDLNFAAHPLCEGLDRIGNNGNSKGTLGLRLHSTLAVGGDGIPLGVARIEFSSPDDEGPKSGRWLRGWRDAGTLKAGRARVVSAMDREDDVFELFAARRDEGGPELLVRALRDRSLGPGGGKLFEALRESPERGRMDIPLERLSARNSARGQSASPGRARRVASAALRWMEVDLQVPEKRRGEFGTRPCRMRAVHAFEDLPRAGAKPLEWMLLTTA
ncbi:MAG: transposase DNA-binding-containing protein, partial [Albidovulum sp.]|nr:transposase DNA-binding-containing protein [Albidovulum sp.]